VGFSVQTVVVRGRPSDEQLDRWATRALARLDTVRFPVLCAAGRVDAGAKPFTVIEFRRLEVGVEVPQLGAASGPVHDLPALPAHDFVDAFLMTIALVAKADGVDAVYLSDSSISDAGCLVLPGGSITTWNDETCDEGRDVAEQTLAKLFGEGAPELEELTWLGSGAPFFQRRLPVAARPSAGGLWRRVKPAS
jgi:hypothetical protein